MIVGAVFTYVAARGYDAMARVAGIAVPWMVLAFLAVFRPSERVNFGLFKYASLYMLVSMILLYGNFYQIICPQRR